jgi:hypothetical protein
MINDGAESDIRRFADMELGRTVRQRILIKILPATTSHNVRLGLNSH